MFLTIVIMVAIDYLVGIPSPKLNVPEKFEVSVKTSGYWFFGNTKPLSEERA